MRRLVVLVIMLLSGCGYHTPGSSTAWVGGDARSVSIQLFVNQTGQPYLDNYMTEALVSELSRSRFLTITENPELAELLLVGEVKHFNSYAISYGSNDRITDYRASMTIAARLVRRGSSEVLWQEDLQRSEDYLATLDKNLQESGERLAAIQVAQRLAEDINAHLINSF
jgi:outer membrane lipopolysaccharide assembly protein LptE/RlpB